MSKFRIMPHGRLHEWVAEEKGYFRDEGLEYEFVTDSTMVSRGGYASIQSADGGAPQVVKGAFEQMEQQGATCDVNSACHWAVNMASSGNHGRMWGHAYSVAPAAVVVPPESAIRTPADLKKVPIGVGYHSGSHFSTVQGLQKIMRPEEIELSFIGGTQDRLFAALDRKIPAVSVFSVDYHVLLQQGFRVIVDTTFMIGHMISNEANMEDVEKFFRAMKRAQKAIDLAPEQYKHYLLKAIPERLHSIVDVTGLGPCERIVFEDYTREMYEETHRWMEDLSLFPNEQLGNAAYEVAVLV
jgi:NitT/TauT family transport system substrate-binding protein